MSRKRKKRNKESLGPFYLGELHKLFKKKGWEISETYENSLYNRFVKKMKNLDTSEDRDLFLKLSKNFEYIDLNEYQNKFVNLLEKMVKELVEPEQLKKKRTFYIMPLKQEKDKNEIKSSDCITYLCKGTNMFYSNILSFKKFKIMGNLDAIRKNASQIKDKTILLIDDFIGSATYASKAIDELANLMEEKGLDKNNIVVLTIYIHEEGLKSLENKGIQTIYLEKLDDRNIRELNDNELERLFNIEYNMKVGDLKEDLFLGFKQSGCLVSLIRTPNNTLPMFWMNKNTNDAPFPRE